MPRFILIAINRPTDGAGDDEEFNRWYSNEHRAELLSVDGGVSARRFRIVRQAGIDLPYVALTEIQADDADTVMRELQAKASKVSDTIDSSHSVFILAEEIEPLDDSPPAGQATPASNPDPGVGR